jgi:predicted dehydrogenase
MTLRIGIVGCGKIADSHVEQVRAVGGAEVVAVCDREPLMAEQLAARMGIPATHSDVIEMITREKLDVVHIATPPDSHRALATLAMRAGAHVFLEKPVALDGAQTRDIVAVARETGRKLSVNYLYNFEAPSLELREWLAADRLGRIVHVDATYGYDLAGDYGVAVLSDAGHWVHRLPGKLFHNVLDHLVCKLAMVVPNVPAEAQCVAYRSRPAVGNPVIDALPDELRVTLKAGDVTATALVSAHARPVGHTMRVFGSRDSVAMDFVGRTLVPVARQTQPSALGRLFPAFVQAKAFASAGRRNVGRFRRHEFHFFQGMRLLLDGFYRSIREDSAPPIAYDEILWSVDTIDRIVEAIARSTPASSQTDTPHAAQPA